MFGGKPSAPFKGKSASDLLQYVNAILENCPLDGSRMEGFAELTTYLMDIDADCNRFVAIDELSDNPTGLTPLAMVEKMDIVLFRVFEYLSCGVSEEFYVNCLGIFEHSVLKLHRPNYVQFVTYYLTANQSRERADMYLSMLFNILHDISGDMIARRLAVSYVGSFVSNCSLLANTTPCARVGKYLVSFMYTLNIQSVQDRLLLVLCVQILLCEILPSRNWPDPSSSELDWISRSAHSLCALLDRGDDINILRLLPIDQLIHIERYVGTVSLRLKQIAQRALEEYKQILPLHWKPLLDFYRPFAPPSNLPRVAPILMPLQLDSLSLHTSNNYFDDTQVNNATSDDTRMEEDDEIWNYREITAALASSPIMSPLMAPTGNTVLTRILSSKSFAAHHPEI